MVNVDKKELSLIVELLVLSHTTPKLMLDKYEFFSLILRNELLLKVVRFPIHRHFRYTQEFQMKLQHDSLPLNYKFHQAEFVESNESNLYCLSYHHNVR